MIKKTFDSTERVHFIVSMTNLLHIYTKFLFIFIFWKVICATQWQCRSLFIFIPTNSICMRLSWLCDTVFLSSAISLSLEAVLCATCDRSVSLFTHCVQREEKKFHEKCETWHSWRNNVTYQNGKKKIYHRYTQNKFFWISHSASDSCH